MEAQQTPIRTAIMSDMLDSPDQTRNTTTVLGPYQNVDITLIEDFLKHNKMREIWAELLTHPPELHERTLEKSEKDVHEKETESPGQS